MAGLALLAFLFVLTIVGLMPGSIHDRSPLLALALAICAAGALALLYQSIRDHARRGMQSARQSEELELKRWGQRQRGLRQRGNPRSRSRNRSLNARSNRGVWNPRAQSGSRVLYPQPSLASGSPRVLQSSLRRQEQLRVEQGRAYARELRRRGRFNSEVANAHLRERSRRSGTDYRQRDSITNLTGLLGMTPADVGQTDIEQIHRPSVGVSRRAELSEAAMRHQEALRIEQGRRYAAQDNLSARRGLVSVGELQKRERIRKRRERFWRELDWGCGAN